MNNQIGDEVDNTNHIYSSLSQDFDGDKCGDGKLLWELWLLSEAITAGK
ncbi:MAG: hypothetical protein KAH25_11425 [Bacteroidales bacterium]|nr:hypothetical protein [Bacteroidales bacterium]